MLFRLRPTEDRWQVMRRIVVVLASVALALGLLFSGFYSGISADLRRAAAQTASTRPNIVFILTDDMRKDDLGYMPKTRSLLGGRGMSFENAFVSNALCAPSRATIMRGQYSHGNGVWSNSENDSPSTDAGGWQAYRQKGNEADNVATRLHGAGYRTGLFGKYINRYANTSDKPRGWDRWFAASAPGSPRYFNYNINDNGTRRHYGTNYRDYATDVLSRTTNSFIKNSAPRRQPFFAYVAPIAPHAPATPAPRDVHTYDGLKAPRSPSFDEKDVSDKPPWIRRLPRLARDEVTAIDFRHERRVESLQAVDDLVRGVVDSLGASGEARNTYIFFTSDNGFHEGEHRVRKEKWRPYEEDISVPLLVRGPGVKAGTVTRKMALNTDYLPTFTDLARTRTPSYADGRSLEPVLHGSVTKWRSAVLLEAAASRYSPSYGGVRTIRIGNTPERKYVEYAGRVRELYGLDLDPYERTNHYTPSSPVADSLAARLGKLEDCAGDKCFTAENKP